VKRQERKRSRGIELEEILAFCQRELALLQGLEDDRPIPDKCYKVRGQLRLGIKRKGLIDIHGQRISWECNIEGCMKKSNGIAWSKIISHHKVHHYPRVHFMEIAIRQAMSKPDMIRYALDRIESVFSRKKIILELEKVVKKIIRNKEKKKRYLVQ
jgi:hypothetical protein